MATQQSRVPLPRASKQKQHYCSDDESDSDNSAPAKKTPHKLTLIIPKKRPADTASFTTPNSKRTIIHLPCKCIRGPSSFGVYCDTCKDFPQQHLRHKPDTTPEPEPPAMVAELKCPVCYEIPKGEVFQCKFGHLICSPCLDQVKASHNVRCPTCRLSLLMIDSISRNRLAENLINGLNYLVKCTSVDCGELVPFNQFDSHMSSCDYRIVRCTHADIVGCKWTGYASTQTIHDTMCIRSSTNVDLLLAFAHPEIQKCKFAPFGCSYEGNGISMLDHNELTCAFNKMNAKELMTHRLEMLITPSSSSLHFTPSSPSPHSILRAVPAISSSLQSAFSAFSREPPSIEITDLSILQAYDNDDF